MQKRRTKASSGIPAARQRALGATILVIAMLLIGQAWVTPARASGSCPTPVGTLSLGNPEIVQGESTSLSWSITGATGHCSTNADGARVAILGPGTSFAAEASGSMTISSSMLGYGASIWSLFMHNADGDEWILAQATVTMWPAALPNGSQVTIADGTTSSRATFLAAVRAPMAVIRIAGNVNLDLSNMQNIPVAAGVQILGDRSVFPSGPRLFTTTVPTTLLAIDHSDHVRITGIRLEGGETDDPFSGMGPIDSDGIGVFSSQNVEIDHNELYHWRGAAVNAHDGNDHNDLAYLGRLNQDTMEDNTRNVWVHDNYIHHNQHPSAENCLSGGSHAGGYGVVVTDGAYAKIERNVFDWNRHSIAGDGKAGDGYVVRDNLILQNGGVHFKCIEPDSSLWVFVLNPFVGVSYITLQALDPQHIYHTHAIDMHGVNDCHNGVFTGDLSQLGDHNCGAAGEYMDVEFNTILYTQGNGIHLRGFPQRASSSPAGTKVGMDVFRNVFAHTEHDGGFITPGAMVANDIGLHDLGSNSYGLNTFNARKSCDFDGDGSADSFMATGIGWWYQSTRYAGRWVFAGRASYLLSDITLADVNGDGRCDVIAGGRAYDVTAGDPSPPSLPMLTSPGAQSSTVGAAVNLRLTSTGGFQPYTWTASGLPAGLSLNSFGQIVGTVGAGGPGTSTVTVTVTDLNHQSNTVSFVWNVLTTVPDVTMVSSSVAQSRLSAAGLFVNSTRLVWDCTDIPGTVLGQNPAAGTSVPLGTGVGLSVSSLTDANGRRCQLN